MRRAQQTLHDNICSPELEQLEAGAENRGAAATAMASYWVDSSSTSTPCKTKDRVQASQLQPTPEENKETNILPSISHLTSSTVESMHHAHAMNLSELHRSCCMNVSTINKVLQSTSEHATQPDLQ